MKEWFKNFIKKIEEANKNNFGSKRLDCCNINEKNNQHNISPKKKCMTDK